MPELRDRLVSEWPAVLAIAVLVLAHVYLTVVRGGDGTPLGIPLFAAIVVFVLAEAVRRFSD